LSSLALCRAVPVKHSRVWFVVHVGMGAVACSGADSMVWCTAVSFGGQPRRGIFPDRSSTERALNLSSWAGTEYGSIPCALRFRKDLHVHLGGRILFPTIWNSIGACRLKGERSVAMDGTHFPGGST